MTPNFFRTAFQCQKSFEASSSCPAIACIPGQNAPSELMKGFTTRPLVMCTSTGHTIPLTAWDSAEYAWLDE